MQEWWQFSMDNCDFNIQSEVWTHNGTGMSYTYHKDFISVQMSVTSIDIKKVEVCYKITTFTIYKLKYQLHGAITLITRKWSKYSALNSAYNILDWSVVYWPTYNC